MSVFTNNTIETKPSKFINTYLVNMTLYGKDIQTASATEGYYNILYTSSDSTDVTYKNKTLYRTPNFQITNVYFLPLIHNNISNVTDGNGLTGLIGEFALKLVNSSNSDCPLYIYYLVQSVGLNKGTDDTNGQSTGSLSNIYNDIIKATKSGVNYGPTSNKTTKVSPGTDGTIPSQDDAGCIMYVNNLPNKKSEIHCIFLNPITISNTYLKTFFTSLDKSTPLSVFGNYPSGGFKYILTSSTAKSTDTTNADEATSTDTTNAAEATTSYDPNSQIYIDCSPTGVSEEKVASYNLPINSTLIQDIQHSSLATLCANFVLFGFILAATYIGIPTIYNLTVNKSRIEAEKMTMVRYSKLAILLYFLLLSIILFIDGNVSNNIYELMVGILLIFVSILSYILLSSEELQRGVEPGSPFDIKFITFIGSILARIGEQWGTIFSGWIALLLIMLLLWGFAKNSNGDPLINVTQLWKIILFVGLLIIPPFVGLMMWIAS